MPTIPIYDEEGKFKEFKFTPDTPTYKQITSYSYNEISSTTLLSTKNPGYQDIYFKNSTVSDGDTFDGFNYTGTFEGTESPKISSTLVITFAGGSTYTCNFPCIPDEISESTQAYWNPQNIIGRASPVAAMTGTSFRNTTISMKLHRDMYSLISNDSNYIDKMLANARRGVYPKQLANGYVPAVVTFTSVNFKIKGMLKDISYSWQKPLIKSADGNDLCYAVCDLKFSIDEIMPKNFDGATSTVYFKSGASPFAIGGSDSTTVTPTTSNNTSSTQTSEQKRTKPKQRTVNRITNPEVAKEVDAQTRKDQYPYLFNPPHIVYGPPDIPNKK